MALLVLGGERRLKLSSNSHVHSHQKDQVEERGLAVASIVSLFGISYTRWESIVHFWVFSEMEHFTVSAFCGVWQGDKLQTLQQLKADLATNEMN